MRWSLCVWFAALGARAAATAAAEPVAEFNLTSRARHGRGLDFILQNTGVSRERFFREYYEKEPVFLPRSGGRGGDFGESGESGESGIGDALAVADTTNASGHYGDLFPFEAVASIIDCFPDQRKLDDWVVVKEAFVTDSRYKKVTEYYAAYLRGETLGMFILNRLWATLGLLVDDLDADFGFPWRVNLYLTPRGAQGFMPHTDQHDFFILQTGGRKRWRVYGNPVPLNTRAQEQGKHGAHLDEAELGDPLLDVVMEQGDALYVPRGYIHVADTFDDTGSLHLTVRGTNSFFFNMGHLFNAALAKDGEAKAVPPKRLGLPKMNQLQEFDLDFRRSTPVRWLLAEPERSDMDSAGGDTGDDDGGGGGKVAAPAVAERNDLTIPAGDPSRGVALLGYGMGHGGDALHVCKARSSGDGPSSASRNGEKQKCTVGNRWVNAMMRAAAAYRKSSRGVVRANKARVKKWLAKTFDLARGAATLRGLRQKIHTEHHALLGRVAKMFMAKGGMRPRVPLSGWIRINPRWALHFRETGSGYQSSHLLDSGAPSATAAPGAGGVVPHGRVVIEGQKKKTKTWVGVQFRAQLAEPLRQLAALSRVTNKDGDTKPFRLSDGFGAADDFETLSLAEVLLDLGWIERLEVKQVPKEKAMAQRRAKKKKKKKKGKGVEESTVWDPDEL